MEREKMIMIRVFWVLMLGLVGLVRAECRPCVVARQEISPTSICTRWAQQSVLVGSLLYIYGGRSTTTVSQTSNTWNNNFITLDLSSSFNISSPPVKGLALPNGPPAVASGALWASTDGKYLYQFAGEFSDTPPASPTTQLMWRYDIPAASWSSISTGGDQVTRPAEGATCVIPGQGTNDNGLGVYLGGHLDAFTVPGWSVQVAREYLQSMVIFDMDATSFKNYSGSSFPSPARADGAVVYVPGLGTNGRGILVSLAGGTNTFQLDMTTLDIFDLSTLTWSKQPTQGTPPLPRVNPCAVLVSDSGSQNIYLYGGQNVSDSNPRPQYDDMWVLALPSFTWVQVGEMGGGNPAGRSGHTCYVVGGQMVVVGGNLGAVSERQCDSPGIYVFDMSRLEWTSSFDSESSYSVPELVVSATGGSQSTDTPSQTQSTTQVSSTAIEPPASTNPSMYTMWTTATATTTFADGQTAIRTTTFQTTATVTATPVTSSSSSLSPTGISGTKLAAVVGGSLGAVILLLVGGWGLYALRKRRQGTLWNRLSGGGSSVESPAAEEPWSPMTERGWGPANDEAEDQTREWDVSNWDGNMRFSPRQSLRVVNE